MESPLAAYGGVRFNSSQYRLADAQDPVQSCLIHQTPQINSILWKLLPGVVNWSRTRGETYVMTFFGTAQSLLVPKLFHHLFLLSLHCRFWYWKVASNWRARNTHEVICWSYHRTTLSPWKTLNQPWPCFSRLNIFKEHLREHSSLCLLLNVPRKLKVFHKIPLYRSSCSRLSKRFAFKQHINDKFSF